ncbi:alpha/beta fold hydrolase [Allopontixanthobacter sediminis]|uniref:Alpha/beta fold hydrolase n=1 Tax=Allopontixanthobacter sediminis TaxID=1689985 RepID=A0A845B569_9SPHN|nr:alpha/beta hydrolase [Allopontixanthobacter sediminis]MXP45296.1 alpha/beta fold hydrolase [Allopontixanthobacter sediminis]
MRALFKGLLVLVTVLVAAFLFFRTPDTDPAEMRAKYGGPPSQFVDLDNGLTVHVRDEGPRDAPAIVLLHGSNADLHTWQEWVRLLGQDYRIIRFDQIGHGLTGPAPNGDYSTAAFVETVDQVASSLGLERFILGGNSMGGQIAMAYAIAHPDRLDALILVDAGGAPQPGEGGSGNIGFTIARMPVVNQLMTQITPRPIIEQSLSQSVSNQAVVTPQAVDRYWELLRYPGNRAATLARFGKPAEAFTDAQVARVTVPTLIIWGEDDALIPFSSAAWFAKNLPESTLVSYPGIGHLPMEEAPVRSADAVREWLGEPALATAVR